MTNLEDSLRDYYASTADGLVLPDRVFDSATASDDAAVSYISMGPEPRRRAPVLLAAAASIALLASAGVVVSRNGETTRNPAIVSNATDTAVVACSVSANASDTGLAETECSKVSAPPLWPTFIPAAFSLSKVDESVGNNGNSRWHVLHYKGTETDGFVGEIRVVMENGASADSNASIAIDSGNSWSRGFSIDEIFLRGVRATISRELSDNNPVIAMSWRERPDLLVSIEANSTSLEDLTRMSESLVSITREILASAMSGGAFFVANGRNAQGYIDPDATTTATGP